MLEGTKDNTNTFVSVTKESKSSAYPGYFYNPKENLFEKPRGSLYDSKAQ